MICKNYVVAGDDLMVMESNAYSSVHTLFNYYIIFCLITDFQEETKSAASRTSGKKS
ncbi:hypothetical protein [uncultured Flavobacterium sp.]|uniref:hypothetical protein n=1 Tax=uncultured Flavobacterium sp. TaxID=165435 RepID=UPI00292E2982|nr:hypothetical protein [uncultured Flavobacterium sp.]